MLLDEQSVVTLKVFKSSDIYLCTCYLNVANRNVWFCERKLLVGLDSCHFGHLTVEADNSKCFLHSEMDDGPCRECFFLSVVEDS